MQEVTFTDILRIREEFAVNALAFSKKELAEMVRDLLRWEEGLRDEAAEEEKLINAMASTADLRWEIVALKSANEKLRIITSDAERALGDLKNQRKLELLACERKLSKATRQVEELRRALEKANRKGNKRSRKKGGSK